MHCDGAALAPLRSDPGRERHVASNPIADAEDQPRNLERLHCCDDVELSAAEFCHVVDRRSNELLVEVQGAADLSPTSAIIVRDVCEKRERVACFSKAVHHEHGVQGVAVAVRRT
jgi:hypothetical protein